MRMTLAQLETQAGLQIRQQITTLMDVAIRQKTPTMTTILLQTTLMIAVTAALDGLPLQQLIMTTMAAMIL